MTRQYEAVLRGEDPVVAEVRKVRHELFSEFNYDLDVYVAGPQGAGSKDGSVHAALAF